MNITIGVKDKQPVKFTINADESIVRNNQPYEPEISELFCRWLRPGDCVVDVGANVGWFSMLGAALVGPTGKVFAFEPGPENFQILQENAHINKYDGIIKSKMIPLSDVPRERKFYLNPKGHGGHALWPVENGIAVNVQTETLDEQDFPEKIRVLKIDTEGHEQRILTGAQRILNSQQAPDFIFAEYHHTGLACAGDTEHSMRMFMSNRGYHTFLLPPHSYLPIYLPTRVLIKSQWAINYLFVREANFSEMPEMLEIGTLEPK